MKSIFIILSLLLSFSSFAHDGGHGSIAESGKFGGVLSPIVLKKEAGKGDDAHVLYKAELVRNESGKLSFYLFDNKMNLMDLKDFSEEIKANLEVKKKGKFTYVVSLNLKRTGITSQASFQKLIISLLILISFFLTEKKIYS